MEVVSCRRDRRLRETSKLPEVKLQLTVLTQDHWGLLLHRNKGRKSPASPLLGVCPLGHRDLSAWSSEGGEPRSGCPLSHAGPWLSESGLSMVCRYSFGLILRRPKSSPHQLFPKVCFSPHRHQRDSIYPADGDEAQPMLPEREGSHVTRTPF